MTRKRKQCLIHPYHSCLFHAPPSFRAVPGLMPPSSIPRNVRNSEIDVSDEHRSGFALFRTNIAGGHRVTSSRHLDKPCHNSRHRSPPCESPCAKDRRVRLEHSSCSTGDLGHPPGGPKSAHQRHSFGQTFTEKNVSSAAPRLGFPSFPSPSLSHPVSAKASERACATFSSPGHGGAHPWGLFAYTAQTGMGPCGQGRHGIHPKRAYRHLFHTWTEVTLHRNSYHLSTAVKT